MPASGARRCSRASPRSRSWGRAGTMAVWVDLERIVRLADFEPLAREAMEPAAFEYYAGGSWDERTLRENEAAWTRRTFRPRVLVDLRSVDVSTTLLGRPASLPAAIAPMAVQGLAHPEGELA